MHLKDFYYLILTCFVCVGCSTQEKKKVESKPELDLQSGNFLLGEGLIVKEFSIDTIGVNRNFKGIFLTFIVESDAYIQDQIKKNGFSAVFINAEIKQGERLLFTSSNKERSYYHAKIRHNKANFVSKPGTHYIDIAIPFFALKMEKGQHPVKINIQALPAKFSADTTLHDYRELEYIGQKVFAQKEIDFVLNAPALDKKVLTVTNFTITNTKAKKGKFDFSIAGKGLPDPYWQLNCDEEIIFSSKPEKNTLKYQSVIKTDQFYHSPLDIFTISIYDHDKGPFNRKDPLGSWTGTISELNSKTELEFGKIKGFKFKLD